MGGERDEDGTVGDDARREEDEMNSDCRRRDRKWGEHVFGEWRNGIFYSWLNLAVSRLSYEEAMGALAVYFYTSFPQLGAL